MALHEHGPPTDGRVTLRTSLGDVDIELYPKLCPKACRNFMQHCLDQYYDGCAFHRVVKGFCVQTGDPTSSGGGGVSAYSGGKPFKNEITSRLRFKHRGMVAMAGEDGDNRSQFFITLGPTPTLNDKHTIFGRVVPETFYPILNMEGLEVDGEGRPSEPPVIKSTTVVSNPYEDMVARTIEREETARGPTKPQKEPKKKARKAVKNKAMLSCADEWDKLEEGFDADDGVVSTLVKGARVASAHHILEDRNLKKDQTHTEERKREIRKAQEAFEQQHGKQDSKTERLKRKVRRAAGHPDDGSEDSEGSSDESIKQAKEMSQEEIRAIEDLKLRQAKAKADIMKFKKKPGEDVTDPDADKPKSKGFKYLEEQRAKFARAKTGGSREKDTILKLQTLTSQLKRTKRSEANPEHTADLDMPASVKAASYAADQITDKSWFKTTLKFANPDAKLGGNLVDDNYRVIDPLEAAGADPNARAAAKRLRTEAANISAKRAK